MKKILLSILLLPSTLYAQIPDSDSLNWKADLALSGLYQAGNVETKVLVSEDPVVKPSKPIDN